MRVNFRSVGTQAEEMSAFFKNDLTPGPQLLWFVIFDPTKKRKPRKKVT